MYRHFCNDQFCFTKAEKHPAFFQLTAEMRWGSLALEFSAKSSAFWVESPVNPWTSEAQLSLDRDCSLNFLSNTTVRHVVLRNQGDQPSRSVLGLGFHGGLSLVVIKYQLSSINYQLAIRSHQFVSTQILGETCIGQPLKGRTSPWSGSRGVSPTCGILPRMGMSY